MKSKQKDIKILKNALRNLDLSRQEYVRVQAVLLRKKGYRLKQITDISNKKLVTIQGWITCYNQSGIEGLKTKEKAPSRYTLTKKQKERVKNLITGHKPEDYGLSSDFWSASTLKQLVKDKFKTEYKTVKSYRELLKYCGFSYQKAEHMDKRKGDNISQGHFKKRFEKKVKKGVISMWWQPTNARFSKSQTLVINGIRKEKLLSLK